jgi:hypothetical protein
LEEAENGNGSPTTSNNINISIDNNIDDDTPCASANQPVAKAAGPFSDFAQERRVNLQLVQTLFLDPGNVESGRNGSDHLKKVRNSKSGIFTGTTFEASGAERENRLEQTNLFLQLQHLLNYKKIVPFLKLFSV